MALLERDRELDRVLRAFAEVAAGTGSGLAVSGEPGAGKSALVAAACARANGLRILRGGCDPLTTPRPLGPFRDLFVELGSWDPSAPLTAVCDASYDALRSAPSVLVVEDVHWVDAASAEVLRFLVRRLDSLPCVLLLTYRDHEIGPQHPARPLLGDFAALDSVESLRLRPLSVTAVATMVAGTSLPAARVHAVTGGNPFFVAEVAKEPDLPLARTVRDAVLARTSGVATDDFEVLQLAAAAPNRLDDRVLPALGVDLPTLRRLWNTGLLLRDQHGLVYTHELARLALESTIPAGGAPRLLDALESVGLRDPAVLTHHAAAAHDPVRTARYAQQAAEEAARTGSHTEAVAFLQIALASLPDSTPAERAQLQLRLGFEQYMISQLDKAIASIESTFPYWIGAGDLGTLSAAHDSCAVFEYYNAHRPEAEQHAERAVDLAPAGAGVEYGSAQLTRAYLAYQHGEHDVTDQFTTEALQVADHVGSQPLILRGRLVRAITDLARGVDGARERAVALTERARSAGLDELTSTGYSHTSYLDVEQGRFRSAERLLEVSLPFAFERDIVICHQWQTAVRCRLRFREGRWDAALEDAAQVLKGSSMPVARFWPLLVTALVTFRRGGDGSEPLAAARELAHQLDEPLRLLPALAGFAEVAWLTGRMDDQLIGELDRLQERRHAPALRWAWGEVAVWLRRLGLESPVEVDSVAEPYRLTLSKQFAEAAAWWHQAGAVHEEAMAYANSADLAQCRQGIERLDLLGATASADRLRRTLREQGVAELPARPRSSTRANPAGLTNRQLDVAKLVARGFTNAEIAEQLFISLRTTDHHVSAVLTKLGLPSRRAVVVQASDLGLS